MRPEIHIGTSGFNNKNWQSVFYPADLPKSQWFEYYCEHFTTFELNSTFYKFPTERSLKTWHDLTPPHFKFSIKAPKVITHEKKFDYVQADLFKFYAACQGLKAKLSCILFQLPPSFAYSQENLEKVLAHLNPTYSNVIEFRHSSWWRSEVFAAMKNHNCIFCNVSYPGLPSQIILTNAIGYLRLHGDQELFHSGYSADRLQFYLREIKALNDASVFFIYFNNTAGIHGILNAMHISNLLP